MKECLTTTKDLRNVYIRYILNLLRNKYHVTLACIAEDIGIGKNYLNDFSNGARNFGHNALDKVEYYLEDLYGAILEYEIPKDDKDLIAFLEVIEAKESRD